MIQLKQAKLPCHHRMEFQKYSRSPKSNRANTNDTLASCAPLGVLTLQ